MNKKLVLLSACLLTAGSMTAQKRVTGHVADANGEPVAGATVRVQGTKIWTQTDTNGNFTLSSVPSSAKQLEVSYVGMEKQSVSVAGNMNIVLKDKQMLEEAVVVGYGTAKKLGTVVGSVTKVSSDKIENKPVTTALDALQGKVAGVQILSSSGDAGSVSGMSTTVRGNGSLNGGNEPLFVIDGSPVASDVFYMMNQNDIASYTVLRDASATSIYGSRAANGVIYVTTKKGHANERAVVKVGQSIGWSQLARRQGNPMNTAELLEYQLKNGVVSAADYAKYKKQGYNTDWLKYFYKDSAPIYNTTFSVQGGGDKTVYYTSASLMKKEGLTPYSEFKRYTVRTNIESQALDWFRYGVNVGLNYDERNVDSNAKNGSLYVWNNPVLGSVLLPPYWNPYDENGNKKDYFPEIGEYKLETLNKYRPRLINEARITGTAFAQLTPMRGLTLRSQLGVDAYDTRQNTKLLPTAPWLKTKDGGQANEYFDRFASFTITNTAEYKFDIKEDHHLTFLLGQEGIKGTSSAFNSYTRGQSDPRLMEVGSGTKAELPNLYGHTKYEYLSFFGRVDYNLRNKYFANVTIRNDRSSRFGKNNRSATFASGGLMWDMKAEDFLKGVAWLNDLKFKASVGSTGNSSGIGNYSSLGKTGSTLYNGHSGWVLSSPANEELGWETQIQANVGFSARLFDRVNLELDYYHRTTKDMLMSVPLPYTTGFSSQTMNVGTMLNQGIEMQFNVDAVKNWNGLDVNVYGNLAYNANKVTKLFYGLDEWGTDDTGVRYFVGKAVSYYMPIRAGVDKKDGEIMWYKKGYTGDGNAHVFDSNTMTKDFDQSNLSQDTGKKYWAPVTGGFGLTATWKGFTLNADFAYVLGKYMQDNIEFFTMGGGNMASSGMNLDRAMLNQWTKPDDITNVPKFGYSNQFDTSLLHNASFCRLKNLSLSYDLPKHWMEATNFIRNVRLTAAARNLLTITKWKGADPETDANVAAGAYPNTREFSLGVEVTF